ncbi:MAG: YihA family ribosome biogenesis GTP-binding protein [Bacteroidetes bacterium]|nr:YihA family ribosome biogenesis GTP-binding protein [Bacteroidota bacterium]
MEVKNSAYVATYVDVKKCPNSFMPEYAMIGRSNVGKSSLINYICNHKGLAKTSATPGKTQTINYFVINHSWHLVDLPGYGYARVSQDSRAKWKGMIYNYLEFREQLQYVFVLIDSRIPPQAIDLEFINWLGEKNIPFVIVFTKADKPAGKEMLINIENFKNALKETWDDLPDMFVTSSEKKVGKEILLKFIEEANKDFHSRGKAGADTAKATEPDDDDADDEPESESEPED